jgi:hypothetical protein
MLNTPLRLLFCNCCFLSISDAKVSRERWEAFCATDVSPCPSGSPPDTGVLPDAAWTGVVWTGVTLTSLVLAATGVVAEGTCTCKSALSSEMAAKAGATLTTETVVSETTATGDEERRGDRVMGTVKGETSRSISSALNSPEEELAPVEAGTGMGTGVGAGTEAATCGGISGSSLTEGRAGTLAAAGAAVVVAN